MNQSEFVVEYAEYIYTASDKCFKKLKGRPITEDHNDIICDVAVKIIDVFSTKIDKGEFNFKGASKLTTFLYGAVYNEMREQLFGKVYYPKVIAGLGPTAEAIYNFRYLLNYSRREAITLVMQQYNVSESVVDGLDKEISKLMKGSKVGFNMINKKKPVKDSDLDEFASGLIFSDSGTPEEQVIRAEIRGKIYSVLEALRSDYLHIIDLHYIQGKKIDEIRQILGIKNKQVVYNRLFQAKKAFIRESKRKNLQDFVNIIFKGETNDN